MIERRAEADGIRSAAWYSPCEAYRYGLERRWGTGGALLFVMLNPSTATEDANDPTIARCQRRTQQLGFGAMRIANLFGYRATRPRDLARAEAPVGPENDLLLRDWAQDAAQVLAAWGVHGALMGRGQEVAAWLPGDVRHLGLTRDGHPRHPLYRSYTVLPAPWPIDARYPESGLMKR